MNGLTPGWYPDPQNATIVRWYDGSQWTAHTAPTVGQALTGPAVSGQAFSGRPGLGKGWFALAGILQVVLLLAVVQGICDVAFGAWTAQLMSGWIHDPLSATANQANVVDLGGLALSITRVLILLGCGVLFIIWLFQAHRSNRMDAAKLQHGSGWAIGGWFVPILGLWRPYQMVLDAYCGSSGARMGSTLLRGWWAAFVLMQITSQVSFRLIPDESLVGTELMDALRTSATIDAVDGLVSCVAAILAILVVRKVTSQVANAVAH